MWEISNAISDKMAARFYLTFEMETYFDVI